MESRSSVDVLNQLFLETTNITQTILYVFVSFGIFLLALTFKALAKEIINRSKKENIYSKNYLQDRKILTSLDYLEKAKEISEKNRDNDSKNGSTTSPKQSSSQEASTPSSVDDVRSNFELLEEYHSQGISQSKISFWFSILFASLGFSLIAYSVISYINSGSPPGSPSDISKPIFSLVAGTIADAVSALFFVQSNKSRQLMSDFFDKLRTDRKLEESLKLIHCITDEKLRSRLQTMIAINFSDVKFDNGTLMLIYGEKENIPQNSSNPSQPQQPL